MTRPLWPVSDTSRAFMSEPSGSDRFALPIAETTVDDPITGRWDLAWGKS